MIICTHQPFSSSADLIWFRLENWTHTWTTKDKNICPQLRTHFQDKRGPFGIRRNLHFQNLTSQKPHRLKASSADLCRKGSNFRAKNFKEERSNFRSASTLHRIHRRARTQATHIKQQHVVSKQITFLALLPMHVIAKKWHHILLLIQLGTVWKY